METITYNPDAVALIFAAGEAKATVVKDALENKPSVRYPASVLNKLKHARFYLTTGAAMSLQASVDAFYENGEWTQAKTDRAVIDLCARLNKYGHHLTMADLKGYRYCKMIPGLNEDTVLTDLKLVFAGKKKHLQAVKKETESKEIDFHFVELKD